MSPTVLTFPSSHAVPFGFGLHPVWLVAGVHSWHALAGLTVPAAIQAPPMTQLLVAITWLHVPPLPAQASVVQASPSSQDGTPQQMLSTQ